MPLWVPSVSDYRWRLDSTTGRPAAAFGTSITPSATVNVFNAYTQLIAGASVTEDVWFIEINVNSAAVSAAPRNMNITVGIDPAGGSSYTDLINNLLVTGASPLSGGYGVWYAFPLFIPAGSSIAVKVMQNSANTTAIRSFVRLYGQPANPESTPLGYFVETVGTLSSSGGTAVTAGTTSEGAWTALGATVKPTWWFQTGLGVSDATLTGSIYAQDLAANSAGSYVLISDQILVTNASEQVSKPLLTSGCTGSVPGGTTVYGRMQISAASLDTNTSMFAYCLGG